MQRYGNSSGEHAFGSVAQAEVLNGSREQAALVEECMIRAQVFERKVERRIHEYPWCWFSCHGWLLNTRRLRCRLCAVASAAERSLQFQGHAPDIQGVLWISAFHANGKIEDVATRTASETAEDFLLEVCRERQGGIFPSDALPATGNGLLCWPAGLALSSTP